MFFFNYINSTKEETERRSREIEILLTKGIQMQKIFDHQVSTAPSDRSLLLGNSDWITSSSSRRGADVEGPEESVDQIISDQKRMLGGKRDLCEQCNV